MDYQPVIIPECFGHIGPTVGGKEPCSKCFIKYACFVVTTKKTADIEKLRRWLEDWAGEVNI